MKKIDSKAMKYIAKTYGKKFADGGVADEDTRDDFSIPKADSSKSASDILGIPSEANNASDAVNPPVQVADASSTPPAGYDGSPDANPNVPVPPDPSAPPAAPAYPAGSLAAAYEEQKAANLQAAKALGDSGTAEAKAITEGQQQVEQLPTKNDIFNSHKAKDDQLLSAYQSKALDPDHFYKNQSTGQKITTAIALVLGGFSGAAHQQNPVLGMLNDSINKDIDAQKNSQDQQINLWNMNKREYGDEQAANLATKNQILTGVQAKIQAAAASAKSPIALANANQLNSAVSIEKARNTALLGLNATLHGQTQEGQDENTFVQSMTQAAQLAPEMYKDAQTRYLPGVGVAKNPIDTKGRDEISLNQEYSSLLKESEAFQKTLPLNRLAWTPDQRSAAATLAQHFDELGTRAQGINRLNSDEIKLAEKAYNPGKWEYKSALGAINSLQKNADQTRNILMQKYGVVPFKQSAASNAPPTPEAVPARPPNVPPNYVRVKGGWAKPSANQNAVATGQP